MEALFTFYLMLCVNGACTLESPVAQPIPASACEAAMEMVAARGSFQGRPVAAVFCVPSGADQQGA